MTTALLAANAGCGRDAPPPGTDVAPGGADAGEGAAIYEEPRLTPAESAAAVARQAAAADSLTRRVMGPDYRPPAETVVDTPERQYASCMAQAASVDEPVRSTIRKACERFRTRE